LYSQSSRTTKKKKEKKRKGVGNCRVSSFIFPALEVRAIKEREIVFPVIKGDLDFAATKKGERKRGKDLDSV